MGASMTTVLDPAADVVQKLINSCRQAHEGFRCAAEAVDDADLKRLFSIYAQQRTRFAEELREYLPAKEEISRAGSAPDSAEEAGKTEILRRCFDAERRSLEIYGQALANRSMALKAHFLIAAQYSLLQRVHERVRGIFPGTKPNCEERAVA
jgi:hypothetical protein